MNCIVCLGFSNGCIILERQKRLSSRVIEPRRRCASESSISSSGSTSLLDSTRYETQIDETQIDETQEAVKKMNIFFGIYQTMHNFTRCIVYCIVYYSVCKNLTQSSPIDLLSAVSQPKSGKGKQAMARRNKNKFN